MRAGRPRTQVMVIAAWCAMRMTVSREHSPSARGVGQPGFPTPPPVGEFGGAARAQGDAETGFPHPPARGRVWEGKTLPGEPCYPLADAGLRPAHPGPDLREGLGGLRPPRNNPMFIAALCGASRMDG